MKPYLPFLRLDFLASQWALVWFVSWSGWRSMKTRGGARPGSGRKPTPISESRAITLWNQGVSKKDIAKRFGVDYQVIRYFFKKMKMFRT